MEKKRMSKYLKKNKKIIIILLLLLFIVFLIAIISKDQLLRSVYNLPDVEIDKVKIGDTINYNINGYSDWQVIGKDNDSGTIEVVSKTNVKDLELEPDKSIDEYKNKLQELADQYVDNKYAISARSVTKDDLNYFSYEQEFWLDNISKESMTTSFRTWNYNSSNGENKKIYFIPYIETSALPRTNECQRLNIGEICEVSLYGINQWINLGYYSFGSTGYPVHKMISAVPIELNPDNILDEAQNIMNSFKNDETCCLKSTHSPDLYGEYAEYVKPILQSLGQDAIIYKYDNDDNVTGHYNLYENDEEIRINGDYYEYRINGNYFSDNWGTIYNKKKNKTSGVRLVVTLKVKNYEPKKEELDDKLSIGDYIKYSANGYDNWRVLSINKHNNTVDVISGGVVKNITLSGKNDFDDYENILQNEVDNYKNDSAISSRPIQSDDEPALSLLKDKVTPIYFTNDKKEYIKEKKTFDNSSIVNFTISAVGVMNYNGNLNDIVKDSKVLNLDLSGDEAAVNYYKKDTVMMGNDYIYVGDSKYTAGIRPVITIKYDEAEKISNKETEKLEKSSKTYDKVIVREQNNNNNESNNKSKSVDNSKDITANEKEITIVEKKVYNNNPALKYSIIILYFIVFIEFLIIVHILKMISKKKK